MTNGKMTDDRITRDLVRLYEALQDELDRGAGQTCRACGECCHFGEQIHQLYCSDIEAAYLLAGEEPPEVIRDEVCPFLREGRCSRYERRTLACRTYFCDGDSKELTRALTERYVRRLKALHEQWGRPWRYARLAEHLRAPKPFGSKG